MVLGRRLVHHPDVNSTGFRPASTSAIRSGRWVTTTWTRSTRTTKRWSPLGCGCRCPAAGWPPLGLQRSRRACGLGSAGGDRTRCPRASGGHGGRLAPFGHVASGIEIADRTFLVDTADEVTAARRKREFLAGRANTVDVATLSAAMLHAGRELPFGRIDGLQLHRRDRARGDSGSGRRQQGVPAHRPRRYGALVLFDYPPRPDRRPAAGFALPGVFIRADARPVDIAAVIDHYAGTESADIRATDLRGQSARTPTSRRAPKVTGTDPADLCDGLHCGGPDRRTSGRRRRPGARDDTATVVDGTSRPCEDRTPSRSRSRWPRSGCRTPSTSARTLLSASSTWTFPSRCPSPA